ncbi:MAG: phosphatase PAP2 family protein [Bacteroidia bacterium]
MDLFASIRPAKYYLFTYLVFWVACGLLVGILGYNGSFLLVNQWHSLLLDRIMPHLTHLGHGMFVGSIFLIFGRKTRPEVLMALVLSMIAIAIAIGAGKMIFFEDWYRPARVFKLADIHFISLAAEKNQSFPSGHSAVAAAVFFFISIRLGEKSPLSGVWLALISIVACYSRVYIGVHFPGDILVGSLLGIVISIGILQLVTRYTGREDGIKLRGSRVALFWAMTGGLLLLIDLYVIVTQNYL